MCVCVCVCVCVCACVCVCVHVRVYMHASLHLHVCVCVCVYICVHHMTLHAHVCTHVCNVFTYLSHVFGFTTTRDVKHFRHCNGSIRRFFVCVCAMCPANTLSWSEHHLMCLVDVSLHPALWY